MYLNNCVQNFNIFFFKVSVIKVSTGIPFYYFLNHVCTRASSWSFIALLAYILSDTWFNSIIVSVFIFSIRLRNLFYTYSHPLIDYRQNEIVLRPVWLLESIIVFNVQKNSKFSTAVDIYKYKYNNLDLKILKLNNELTIIKTYNDFK